MYKQQSIKSYKHSGRGERPQCFVQQLVYATEGAPSECQQHWPEYGGRDLQSYTV